MLFKHLLIIAFPLILTSCSSGSDPLLGLQIGSREIDWKNKVNELLNAETLTNDDYSFFMIGKDSIKAIYSINEPYPYSKYAIYSEYELYKQGKLRNIVIFISGDSSCKVVETWGGRKNIKEFQGYGPKTKNYIEHIKEYLMKIYGQPIKIQHPRKRQDWENLYTSTYDEDDDKKIKYKWELPDFTVEFLREPYYYDSCFFDTMCASTNIVYKIKDYETEFKKIQKKISNDFEPNDLMSIKFQQPTFKSLNKNSFEISQEFNGISREGPEEARAVTDMKFDIVYLNRFDEEVVRIENCLYEFSKGLQPAQMILGYGGYSVKYGINSDQGQGFEYIRNNIEDYKFKGKGEIIADIKKVVFEDGKILEKTSSHISNRNSSEFTFRYDRYALTQFNFSDFSWKFLEEYEEFGDITIIGDEKKLIIDIPSKGKELFHITKIQKNENGFIASTDNKFILIFANDYNRIAIGKEGSNLFSMFIFKDIDRENINKELLKMIF